MKDRCPTDEELFGAPGPVPDTALAAHLEGCPRCRARLRACEEFMAEPPPPRSARERTARADLAAALERGILEPAGEPDAGAGRSRQAAPPWRRRLGALRWPVLRPALAAAALTLVVLGGYEIVSRPGPERPSGVLRGGPAGAATAMRLTVGARSGGGTILRWTRMPSADAYEVVLYGTALAELARLPAGGDSALALAPGALPAAVAREPSLVCRVIATRGGDEIGRSNLLPLDLAP